MVTLPVYDASNVSVSDGSGSFRPVSGNNAAFEGMTKFGHTLVDVGFSVAKTELSLLKHGQAEQKRMDGLEDFNTLQIGQQQWSQKSQQLQDAASPTGNNMAQEHMDAFDKHWSDYTKNMDPNRRPEFQNRIQAMRTAEIKGVIGAEAQTRGKFIDQAHKSLLEEYGNLSLAGGQGAVGTLKGEAVARVKALNLGATNPALEKALIDKIDGQIERGGLQHAASTNPRALIDSAKGLAADMPKATADTRMQSYITQSKAAGLGPSIIPAIGFLESNMVASVVPRRRDGVLMSSAQGEMQILDGAYGIKNKMDPDEVGLKLGQHLAQAKSKMEGMGLQATPGRIYAVHNLGDGAAFALMRANPNEPVTSVMARVYGDRSFRDKNSGEVRLRREAVLENNPSLYKNGATAGQALAVLDQKMDSAMKKAGAYVGGVEGEFTGSGEVIKQRLSAIGIEASQLTPKDYIDAVSLAEKTLAKNQKEEFEFQAGKDLFSGATRMDPNDTTHKKLVDKFVTQSTDVADRVLKGDVAAHDESRAIIARTNYVPKSIASALEQQILSTGGDGVQRAEALEFLRNLKETNHLAWSASDISKDVRGRLDEYMAARDIEGKTPHEAMKQVAMSVSVEGQKRAEAMKGYFRSEDGKDEVAKLTISGLRKSLDHTWIVGVNLDEKSAEAAVMQAEFRDAYKAYRMTGRDVDAATAMATKDLKDRYGTSNLFTGAIGRSRVMRHPPEANFPAVDGSHVWIEEQGRAALDKELVKRGIQTPKLKAIGDPGLMFMVADTQTELDKRNRRPLTYAIAFKNPRTGLLDMMFDRFAPNHQLADDVSRDKLLERKERESAGSVSATPPKLDVFGGGVLSKQQ